jgi:hypothetical protein
MRSTAGVLTAVPTPASPNPRNLNQEHQMAHPMHLDHPAAERWMCVTSDKSVNLHYQSHAEGMFVLADEHLKIVQLMQARINELENNMKLLIDTQSQWTRLEQELAQHQYVGHHEER